MFVISLIVSTKLYGCSGNKIDKHRNIKLSSINKLDLIHKILSEDQIIDKNEFIFIPNHIKKFHKLKICIKK